MKPKILRSISHPELMVGENGYIYYKEERLNQINDHGLVTRGPMIAYWYDGKIKQLSIARLVYEAHVKQEKLLPNDYVNFLSDNENNVHADNLVMGTRRKVYKNTKPREAHECWLNGSTELFC